MAKFDRPSMAHALVEMRRSAGLTQAQLADKLGVSPAAVSAYEREVHEPSFETLERWIHECGAVGELVVIQRGADPSAVITAAAKLAKPEALHHVARLVAALVALPVEVIQREAAVMELRAEQVRAHRSSTPERSAS